MIRVPIALLALCACAESTPRSDSLAAAGDTVADSAKSAAATVATAPAPGLVLDPATMKVGDTLGGLRAGSVDISLAADDMGYVGNVRFDGEVTVSGERMTHPDFPDVKEVCMAVDSLTAQRLPRFPGDQRRRWLCFEDRDGAARQLGVAGTRGGLTVVIDGFRTVRHFSDVYDTARLVRVVEDRRER